MRPEALRRWAEGDALWSAVGAAFARRDVPPPASLEIDYVRFKPGTSCVLGLRDAGAPVGYVKIFDDGNPAVCARKYHARAKRDGWAEVLPRISGVFFRFPLDRAVSGLAALAEIAKLKHVLHEAVPGLSPAEVRVRARKSSVVVLRYKPERRCVARADLATKDADGVTGSRRIAAQAYGDESGERVLRVLERLERRSPPGLRAPRPLGFHAGRRILLQEWIEGAPLPLPPAPDAPRCGRAVAGALQAVHATDPGSLPRVAGRAASVAHARRVLEDLGEVGADDLARAGGALSRELARVLPDVAPGTRTLVHGDFHDRQLLEGPDGFAILDWDEAGAGDPRVDVGNFLAHLHAAELEGRTTAAAGARYRQTFLEAYASTRGEPADLPFFVALHLAKLSTAPFRSLAADWSRASLAIVERAHDVLSRSVEAAA